MVSVFELKQIGGRYFASPFSISSHKVTYKVNWNLKIFNSVNKSFNNFLTWDLTILSWMAGSLEFKTLTE